MVTFWFRCDIVFGYYFKIKKIKIKETFLFILSILKI